MSEVLDEETKEAIRAMAPERRTKLRDWFDDSPHYREVIEYIDSLNNGEK